MYIILNRTYIVYRVVVHIECIINNRTV